VWSCDFNKEGTKLISCSDDKTLKLWEEQDKSKIMTIFYFFKIKIIFFVKDKNNWKVTATISGYHPRTIYSVKWSHLNNLIATGCANNSIHIFKENENNENESKFSIIFRIFSQYHILICLPELKTNKSFFKRIFEFGENISDF